MDYPKLVRTIVLAGLAYLFAATVFGIITQFIVPYDWASVGGMRASSDWLLIGMYFYGFVLATGATLIYSKIRLYGSLLDKGVLFGTLMWGAVSVPSAFIIYTTMSYPSGFFVHNVAFGLATMVIMGLVIAWSSGKE